jgi:tetratricopeptide (TPR) repeat protein
VADGKLMGRTDGYIAADYLLQHGRRIRRTACPPLSLWESCLTHLADASDLLAVGDGARDRCLLNLAERFYRAADSAPEAAEMLSELMSEQGRYAEAEQILRAALSGENPDAAVRLGYLLMRLDRAEEAEPLLRAALAAGEHGARRALAILLSSKNASRKPKQFYVMGSRRNLTRCASSPRSKRRLRTCCVVHSPVGCKVTPRMRIRLLACSITART